MSAVVSNNANQRKSIAGKQGLHGWIALRAILGGVLFILVVTGILVFRFLPVNRVVLDEGDVSDSDIRAPSEMTYVSQILTEEAKDSAEAAARDIYDPPDARVARQQVTKARQILDYIYSVRHDSYASSDQQRQWIEAIPDLSLPPAIIDQILTLSEESWQVVRAEIVSVVDKAMREEIRETQLDQARRRVSALVGLELS